MDTEKGAASKICVKKAPNHSDLCCVGSKCMAWRWQSGAFSEYGSMKVKNKGGYVVVAEGYCGLAGAPQ